MPDQTNAPDQHDHDKRVHELFMQVIDLPQQEQRAFLDNACGDDTDLRNDVLELLRFNEQQTKTVADHKSSSDRSQRMTLPRGETIGPYTIIDALGEGGFGVVYLAKQTAPVKRLVALKIIKPGMDTKAVIARFEAERQALAMMDHSSIARVFEAGATPEGRPYFAMEFVKGEPINAYCDRHKMDTQARLELFAQVCDAVQHAHQKGVIHRDLKPGNILVTIDARRQPQPKVIDFGIAKATSQSLTEKTLYTQQGQLIGTPEYMSPEQAEMSAVNVDTRSDVYSLGVILYELLSGKLPFDPESLREAGYAEIQRIIREDDPPKPSTKLTTVHGEEARRIADARKTKLAELQSTLRKELEWIPLKALRKERTERYSSAEDLADDVRRYLKGEPLEAGPESASYRFKKLVRRNKGPFIAVALIGLALIGGIIATTIFAVWAKQAQADAEREAARASAVSMFLEDLLESVSPYVAQGHDITLMRMVLQSAASELQDSFESEPLIRADLHLTIGQALTSIGDFESAKEHLKMSRDHYLEVVDEENKSLLDVTKAQGTLLYAQGQFTEAEQHFRQLLETAEKRADVSDSMINRIKQGLAHSLTKQGHAEETIVIWQSLLDSESFPDKAQAQGNLAVALKLSGELERAAALFTEALAALRLRKEPNAPLLLFVEASYADLLQKQFQHEEALAIYDVLIPRYASVLGEDNYETIHLKVRSARSIAALGRVQEAQEMLRVMLEACRSTHGDDSRHAIFVMADLAANTNTANPEEALNLYRQVLTLRKKTNQPIHQVNSTRLNMAGVLTDMGQLEEAEELFLEFFSEASGDEAHMNAAAHLSYGLLLGYQHRWTEAEDYLTQAYELFNAMYQEDHPQTAKTLANLGVILHKQGKSQEAIKRIEQALEIRQRLLAPDSYDVLSSRFQVAAMVMDQMDLQKAEEQLRALVVDTRDSPNRKVRFLGTLCRSRLAQLLESQDRLDQALALREEQYNIAADLLGPDNAQTKQAQQELEKLKERIAKEDPTHPDSTEPTMIDEP